MTKKTPEFYEKSISSLFSIVNKDDKVVPFVLKPEQRKILYNLSGMDIVLKSRQQGISSLILALFTIEFLLTENSKCVVISHEAKATQRLLNRVKYYLESIKDKFPGELPYQLDYNSKYELVNKKKNSVFYIGTAGSRAFGHGDTISNLHVSELSRWDNQERTMVGLLQAVPKGGRVIVETTANGYGNYFYNMWVKNQVQGSAFTTHFIPWFDTPEYIMPVASGTDFTQEEIEIMNQYHLSREQMMWRKWKLDQLNGNIDKFNEQFPATPEEAFIVSGNPVWSPTIIKHYLLHTKDPLLTGNLVGFNPPFVEPNDRGYLKVFKEPNEFHQYCIGADVSEGIIVSESEDSRERDFSCAQVIDRNTLEQVAVWHGRIDPDQFGIQLDLLGRYYNDALIGVERNAMGLTPLIKLRDLNYPNLYYREKFGLISDKLTAELGWVTDQVTKDIIINDATQLLRDYRLILYDSNTIDEMRSFVRGANGRAAAAGGAWDDRVMSYLIAVKMLSKVQIREKGNEIERSENNNGMFMMDGAAFDSHGQPIDPNSYGAEEFVF